MHYITKVNTLKKSNPGAWYREVKATTSGNNSHCNIIAENINPNDHSSIADAICSRFASVDDDLHPLDATSLPA